MTWKDIIFFICFNRTTTLLIGCSRQNWTEVGWRAVWRSPVWSGFSCYWVKDQGSPAYQQGKRILTLLSFRHLFFAFLASSFAWSFAEVVGGSLAAFRVGKVLQGRSLGLGLPSEYASLPLMCRLQDMCLGLVLVQLYISWIHRYNIENVQKFYGLKQALVHLITRAIVWGKKVLFSYNIFPSSNTIPLNGIFSLKNKMCAFLIQSFNKLLLIFKINLGK